MIGPRRPGERFVTRVFELDGVWYLVLRRGARLCARRLTPEEFEPAMRALDDIHAEIEATCLGAS